jgi:putative glutamine amidotransferase
MPKKLVGITTSRIPKKNGGLAHQMSETYILALQASGLIPLVIPATLDEEALRAVYERVDGIVLSGGGDVAPHHYGHIPEGMETAVDEDRDRIEELLIRWSIAADRPLLGICRGSQIMNVTLGGSLIADIPSMVEGAVTHRMDDHPNGRKLLLHTVEVQGDTRLAQILGSGRVGVNSIHHQAIDRLGQGLRITAYAPDGVIEAIELPEARFFLGVQWHPEEIVQDRADMQALFRTFAEAL